MRHCLRHLHSGPVSSMLGLSSGHKKARFDILAPHTPTHLSQSQLADVVLEFLEPYVHWVLYLRKVRTGNPACFLSLRWFTCHCAQVYPEEVFDEPCMAHGVPVRRCPNAQLCDYIRDHLSSVRQWIVDGALDRVSVVIYDESGARVEAHTIKMHAAAQRANDCDPAMWRGFFRDSLSSLPAVCAALKPLPDAHAFTCSFQIECVTASSAVDESRWVTLCGTNSSTMVRLVGSPLLFV